MKKAKQPPTNRSKTTAWRKGILIGLLGILAFAATYGVVHLIRAEKPQPDPTPTGMVWIPGGEFNMGTEAEVGWPDEKPVHRVRVDGFWMDTTEVTNAQFRAFVNATGYVTTAEQTPDVAEILRQLPPGTPPPPKEQLVPGSVVFVMTPGPVQDFGDYSQWWKWTPGACWKHPEGPTSTISGRENHPVVQVSWDDAAAYAKWAGKRLPREAEWEFAARGGLASMTYGWGDEKPGVDGKWQVNIWQGLFPQKNTAADGYERTAPVGSYAANGYGLFDMAGNVWEWCNDWYDRELYRKRAGSDVIVNPTGPDTSADPQRPHQSQRVQRGGSFLCDESYCLRYRPSARHGSTPDTGMSHAGFRCVKDK